MNRRDFKTVPADHLYKSHDVLKVAAKMAANLEIQVMSITFCKIKGREDLLNIKIGSTMVKEEMIYHLETYLKRLSNE